MNPDLLLWLSVAGMVVTCIAAIGSRSLGEFAPHELKEICRRRKSSDRLGLILRHRDQVALAAETLQVVATAVVVGTWVLWITPSEGLASPAMLISSVAGAAVVLLAVEIWIPWAVVRLWAAPFLYHTWPAWQAVSVVLTPLVIASRFVDALMHRLAGRTPEIPDEESFEDDIRTIVSEGHREGLLEEDAREMIKGVIELSDVHVSEIMTPRTDMVSMPMALTRKEALLFVTEVGLTRIPVSDKNRDDIVGILHIKDLLPELAKEPGETQLPWTSLLRDPFYVPETKTIDVLLQEFQRTRSHMAVVLDE
ncbi:MAG: CBS domain-containing protein, partial [Thermoguttaceae bacterium]